MNRCMRHDTSQPCELCADEQRERINPVKAPQIEKSVQVQVMELLQQASAALTRASAIAEQANPMVSSVPVFAEMKETSKKITGMMQAVGKIRGLDK